jgi:hypothetical protein
MKNQKKMKKTRTYTVIRMKKDKNKMIKNAVNQMERRMKTIKLEHLKMGKKRINRLLNYCFQL